jgi:hypothetical protein
MVSRHRFFGRQLPLLRFLFLGIAAAILSCASSAHAQYFQRAVGGISIRPDGLLEMASIDFLGKLGAQRAKLIQGAPADIQQASSLRKVSLRGLEEAIEESQKSQKPLSEEICFLAGLQDIRYIFVYPEQKDIVLVGFGEGWKVDHRGNVVGSTTGRPVLLLDDLLTALRRPRLREKGWAGGGISCSIDPTPEGLQQLRARAGALRTMNSKVSSDLERALGREPVTFTGVPPTSHFASVLVAADYHMKRLAMNFERSPVRGLPSFLRMYKSPGAGMDNMLQRWWLEPKFESVLRSPDGLAWEFAGATVKCMTEEDYAASTGQRDHTGKPNEAAQKWSDKMTEHYDELSVAEPVFGELRNCMTLALVGAVISHDLMAERAGCKLPALMEEATLKTMELAAPTHVDSRVSMVKQGSNWIISASGGVNIQPSGIAGGARESSAPAAARVKAKAAGAKAWYWN